MELKKDNIGFGDITYMYRERDLVLDQKTKKYRDSKVKKNKAKKEKELKDFRQLFDSGTSNRSRIEHMIENQGDFYEYEDFYVFLKYIDVFENLDEYFDFLETEEKISADMRNQLIENYRKVVPGGDLVGFFN
jgi:5-bromo-4-chloroindolyl phosphate hydrolysis protein|tara:strand:- start:1330 stop:1728 length:399 start_codon:yes stop_codon:yes gene_type:complete